MTISDHRRRVNEHLVRLKAVRERCRQEKRVLRTVKARRKALTAALALAQQVAAEVQEQAHRRIADVVSRSLEAVFDEPYRFRIRFERKRGRTEAVLLFERDGREHDPLGSTGGGVVDVAAFALRLSCLLLSRPPRRRLLVLDEPFRFLSAAHRPRVRALLLALAEELDCQIVMVTHAEELRAGKVVEL